MKKKLIVLGMAGALLFSGLSVSAAVNVCGHPARTEYVGTETDHPAECEEHTNCTVYYLYRVESVVCHYCQVEIYGSRTHIGYKHVQN